MQVQELKLDRAKAKELYQAYKKHQHYSEPIDHEIQRAYQLIAQGRMVIRAVASITAAGLGSDLKPKLAIARADANLCWLSMHNGAVTFNSSNRWRPVRSQTVRAPMPASTVTLHDGKAVVPIVPIHLRPKRGLANYHILWEADWQDVPKDPMLLRRIGRGDMWLVVAAWDLTEVERAALATRLNG